MVNSSSALANPHAARPTTNAVFLDPSGRRWRRLRLVMVGVVVAVLGLLAYAVPHLYDTPALDSRGDALGPELTSAETGEHVPLVGEGPLVRVLEVRREGGVVNGYDPFTRRLETTFSTAQAQHIGDQGYAIQRFGYSATATKTMSLTFDDGPDPRWTPELLERPVSQQGSGHLLRDRHHDRPAPGDHPTGGPRGPCDRQPLADPHRRQRHQPLAGADRAGGHGPGDPCRHRSGGRLLPAPVRGRRREDDAGDDRRHPARPALRLPRDLPRLRHRRLGVCVQGAEGRDPAAAADRPEHHHADA